MLISVLIPCYNSEKSIRTVVESTMSVFKNDLPDYSCEFVLVNDCSADGTFEEIRSLANDYPCVHGISLMRNFGQHNGLMCAMNYASGDFLLGMDDDLQTQASEIPKIVHKIEEGYDLVYGVYESSQNSRAKNLTSRLNSFTSRILLGRPKNIRSSNFWCITRAVRNEVIKSRNYNPYVDGLFYRTTHNIANVTIEHHKREFGSSNYTLGKLVRLWISYWNYSLLPLRLVSVIGVAMSIIGFISAFFIAMRKILNPSVPIGWSSIICVMLIFFGFVLLALGTIGEYIGEAVMTLNNAPQYIVRETVNVDETRTGSSAL